MKKIILISFLFLDFIHAIGQVTFPCRVMMNNLVMDYSQNTGSKAFSANCFEVVTSPFSSYGPIILEQDAQTTIRANKSIHLKEGFQAKNYSSSGFAHITLGNDRGGIEPFIMNLAGPVVGKHKKIEIGFKMPEEIENQVSDYLSDANNYIGLNPYDPNKISIEAEFKNQSGSIIIKRHGFYYEYYEKEAGSITTNGTITSGGLIKKIPNNDDMLKWRVRFAPTEVGFWYGTIKIYINGSFYTDIVGINFECVPSNEHGYLEVGVHNRQFRFSDDSTSFYAIGQNLTWPTTLKYLHYSNEISNGTQSYQVANGTEEWLHTFRNLGDNGGNFARTVFYQGDSMNNAAGYDGGQEIEWEKLGDYQSRQHCMFVLDEVFDIAEQKGIFIMLTPNVQNEFKVGTEPGDKWGGNPYFSSSAKNLNNPLKPIGVASPNDFLTNSSAKEYYKRKLRYIHARWGYGPHLACYELISEMNGWTGYEDESFRIHLNDWQWEMFVYQKVLLGARQLISTSYNNSDPHDGNDDHSAFSFVDFTSMHSYANKKHQSIERQKNVNRMLNKWDKPTNFGEMGMSTPPDYSPACDQNDYEKCDGTEWHNALWATAFMESYGAGINWWANDIDAYRAANFPAMKQFFSNVVFEADQWTFNQHWSNDPTEFGSEYSATIEVFAMTTNSSHKAMGWVHQATNWWGNKRVITGCKDRNSLQMPISSDDGDDNAYSAPEIYLGDFQLTGLVPWTQYQVDFYRTDDASGAWYSSQFESSNLLGTLSPAYPGTYYDFAFKASKSGVTFRDYNNSNNPFAPKPDTLACNTKSVKINYIWFNDTLGLNEYEWTWGDRKSSEQFPEIIFDKAGSYLVKLKIKFPNDSVVDFQQLIIVPKCKMETIKSTEKAKIKSNSLTVLPNPANEQLSIYLKEINEYNIIFTDMLGNIVLKSKFENNTFHVICKNWATGLYFIAVSDGLNIYSSKFIKQ